MGAGVSKTIDPKLFEVWVPGFEKLKGSKTGVVYTKGVSIISIKDACFY